MAPMRALAALLTSFMSASALPPALSGGSAASTPASASGIAPSAIPSSAGTTSLAQAATFTATSEAGGIPLSILSGYNAPSPTSLALEPTPTLNGSAEVSALWSQIEAKIPVQTAAITQVVTVPSNYSFGADPPPYEPDYLEYTNLNLSLPKGFLYGVASAATQVEGAAKTDGKGPSSWDALCHLWPSQCSGFTPDVTDNQYYMYPIDIARIKHLGINAYSFSVAWTRLYPLGYGELNEAGIDYYNRLIDALIDAGITPVITLFHWDLPYGVLRKYGGWADVDDNIVADFTTYATTAFKHFGKKVKHWVTFNEPRVFCSQTAGLPYNVSYPEGINSTSAPYRCTYNILRAHGHAVHSYRALVASGEIAAGEIGFKSDDNWPLPNRENNEEDLQAALRHADFQLGIFARPIYGDGEYPETCVETLGDMLPALSDEDKSYIKGSADIFYIDGYRTDVSRAAPNGIENCARNITDPNWPICEIGAASYSHALETGWPIGQAANPSSSWLTNAGPYLRRQFKYLADNFPAKGGIILSEFGFAEPFESEKPQLFQIRWDQGRADYFRDYLNECLLAIHVDGINLRGTFAWSLIDNFEWALGLGERFGLQYVNYTDPELPRTFKLSSYVVRDFGKRHLQD